ncbi:unnamed protein product [Ectocarpus sp. CCAP 1310/34]|nr:unnamed protein product [Ectocarpus sp. CCAP 1310/34]
MATSEQILGQDLSKSCWCGKEGFVLDRRWGVSTFMKVFSTLPPPFSRLLLVC